MLRSGDPSPQRSLTASQKPSVYVSGIACRRSCAILSSSTTRRTPPHSATPPMTASACAFPTYSHRHRHHMLCAASALRVTFPCCTFHHHQTHARLTSRAPLPRADSVRNALRGAFGPGSASVLTLNSRGIPGCSEAPLPDVWCGRAGAQRADVYVPAARACVRGFEL